MNETYFLLLKAEHMIALHCISMYFLQLAMSDVRTKASPCLYLAWLELVACCSSRTGCIVCIVCIVDPFWFEWMTTSERPVESKNRNLRTSPFWEARCPWRALHVPARRCCSSSKPVRRPSSTAQSSLRKAQLRTTWDNFGLLNF